VRRPTSAGPRTPVPAARAAAAILALLVAALGGGSAFHLREARAEPPLPRVLPDPDGRATALLVEALARRDEDALDAAFDLWARAIERHGGALVPDPRDALRHRPARDVAAEAIAALEPALAAPRVDARWGREAAVLHARALRGDEDALARLTAPPLVLTSPGLAALRARAVRALAANRPADAASLGDRWLALAPHASSVERASVAALVAHALERMHDLGGLVRLWSRERDVLDATAHAGGDDATLGARIEAALDALRRDADPCMDVGVDAAAVEEMHLWARAASSDAVPASAAEAGTLLHGLGLAQDDDLVVLASDRRVEALDALTGVRLWRFPSAEREGPAVAPWMLSAANPPVRAATIDGDDVFAVLGVPPATGSAETDEGRIEASALPHEMRTRLVALDAATGALRWTTGTARESDGVLADVRTGVASPPCVAGDAVYVLLARPGVGPEVFLARLDRATGSARWVVRLAVGESLRAGASASPWARLTASGFHAIPWGARPAIAGTPEDGEVCVQTHAGFVAGVDAATGAVRWVRVLPSFDVDELGWAGPFVARSDAPVAAGGSWVVAPLDATGIHAIEARTGRLRWTADGPAVADLAHARLHGVVRCAGRRWLAFAGDDGVVHGLDSDEGALRTRLPSRGDRAGASRVVAHGDGSLGAWMDESGARSRAAEMIAEGSPLAAAARALLARADRDPRAMARALVAARASPNEEVRAAVLRSATALLDDAVADGSGGRRWLPPGEDLDALADAALAVRAPGRAEFLVRVEHALVARDDHARRVRLLERWIDASHGEMVGDGAGAALVQLREDLYAARRLDEVLAPPGARDARESVHAAALASIETMPEPAAREALRRAIGTRARVEALARWAERLASEQRFGDAAAVLSDARCGLAWTERGRAVAWAAREAVLRMRAGDADEARTLALHARLHAGAAAATVLDGLGASWRAHGVHPQATPSATIDLSGGEATSDAAARAVQVLSAQGPGARSARGRFLLARGLALEVWSEAGERLHAIETGDRGWFGATLREPARWLPEVGVLVSSTVPGEPADASGIHADDWILAWDGQALDGFADVMVRIARSAPGVEIPVEVLRDGVRVAARFVPGARPPDGALERARFWVAEDGAWLVGTRRGLLRIEDGGARVSSPWTWDGTGTLQSVDVLGGDAFAVVRRPTEADTLVRVEPTGRELWRRDVPGRVERVRTVGTALLLDVSAPARVVLLDRFDGSVRWEARAAPLPAPPAVARAAPEDLAVAIAGRVWALLPHAGRVGRTDLVVVDAASGRTVHVSSAAHGPRRLAAGGVVAWEAGHVLHVALPNLVTGVPAKTATWRPDEESAGMEAPTVRQWVTGTTVHRVRGLPLRPDSWHGLTATSYAFADGSLRVTATGPLGRDSGGGATYLLEPEVGPDGLLLVLQDERLRRTAHWLPSAPGSAAVGATRGRWTFEARVGRLRAHALSGGRLFLHGDRDARVVPVVADPPITSR
jgi:outer membrane protein assembly factor BamB